MLKGPKEFPMGLEKALKGRGFQPRRKALENEQRL
jgi:hypothetical protein